MTDSSMNFGPAWIRNLRPEGTTTTGGGTGGGSRYQLAEYRYGREEMLALFDKFVKPPSSLVTFKTLYSEQTLVPLALLPITEEEQRGWQNRPTTISGAPRGRGGSLERGGRISRGRGGYQAYGRAASAYDSGWGNGEQPDWSPRKEFATRSTTLMDNWRRVRNNSEDDDGWRNISSSRSLHEKWGRSASWRGEGDSEERNGPPERGGRPNWHENNRGGPLRRSWDNEDHLPEWATENPTEGGGTFDERGAFHGSDDEQDNRKENRRDLLQKSISQQHIPNRTNQPVLSSSKSTTSLTKSDDSDKYKEEPSDQELREDVAKPKESSSPEKDKPKASVPHKTDKRIDEKDDRNSEESKLQCTEKPSSGNGPSQDPLTPNMDKVDEDFDRLQEDLVLKLVVDEETPKSAQTTTNFDVTGVQPPPNLVPPSQEKWYYQDPQGTRQGPFANVEMAEWYKAGYFSNQLNVMRECDERYFLLGELINLCGGDNPFLSNIRFPVLKNEAAKLPDDMLPYQFLSQLAFKQQVSLRNLAEPWSALTLQQQELAAQRLLLQQQQQQIPHDLQFMQQSTPSNPLMFMINQMQQSNKLPGSVLVDKPGSSVPNQLDPLLVQMGNMHSLQNRMQTPGLHNHLPGGVPANLSSSLPPDGLGSSIPNLQTPPMGAGGMSALPGIHGSLPSGLPGSVNVNRPTSHTPIDQLPPGQDSDPIANFLKQFQQQRQLPMDSLWQKQNQFNVAPPVSTPTQWPQQPEPPLTMWDLQTSATPLPSEVQPPAPPAEKPTQQEKEKEQRPKEEVSQKELKKRKEQEEKQAKKEVEERRKQEQKKQEAEKKAAEEKKKKEEEKIRKELEKAKKEAEEKRLRELEEKRRLKEQRKAEEEARKKSEELKKLEEEKIRRESKEREEKKQVEVARLVQNQGNRGASKSAPWCQSNFTQGVNLTEIQKAEKEKRAQESALQIQKQQLQEQQQQQLEKSSGIQLNWAKKPIEPRKVKSFAEIQAEEQERLAKLTAEARLAAQLKEKEAPVPVNSGNIWNGQSLTWANASSTSQWSSNSAGGFWDEVPTKSSNKPSTVSKSNSTSAMTTTKQQQQKQSKSKPKKEESPKSVNNNNNQTKDEFTDWCYKTLSNISADVDIPTFVTFLRDIESAYDVRDYCKEYLGESPATQQFASNFLEKRRSFKPKNNAHKDDMCSPAPAITPSMQHSNEFQEVKGKNKKNKKSKMLKVDSRILGFNVTSAPDRINVGDRDYGDNS